MTEIDRVGLGLHEGDNDDDASDDDEEDECDDDDNGDNDGGECDDDTIPVTRVSLAAKFRNNSDMSLLSDTASAPRISFFINVAPAVIA